jgi:rod shape-determining protein MreD
MLFVHRLILTIVLFLLVLLQVNVVPVFTAFFPDLFLIAVLSLCWSGKRDKAVWAAFLGGVVYDLLSVRPLGGRSLLLIAIVSGVSLIRRWVDSFLSRFLSAFLASLSWRLYPGFCFSGQLVYLALLDAAVFTVFFPVLAAVFNRLFLEEDFQLSFKDKLR